LAPYGSCRVPPPPTGNHSSAAGYYTPTTPPTVTVPSSQSKTTLGAPSARATQTNNQQMAASGSWKSANAAVGTAPSAGAAPEGVTSAVQQASHSEPVADVQKQAVASPPGTLKLNGMRVNDATSVPAPTEPARFVPPTGMIPINQAAPTPTPAPGPAAGTVMSSVKASDQASPGTLPPAASGSTLNWQSR
jgi:hypothetical protein